MDFETNFIENNESKKMFEEILVNFYHHNYRSCIVALNTLLYYDLMKKIEILNDNYKDKKPKAILDEISKYIENDEKYSETEMKLLDLCREKNIISTFFYEKSLNLRKIRNHCAHPAFYIGEDIYIPKKSEVVMYIDFIYNELLIIDAINYYDAVNFVLDDIKEAYDKGLEHNNSGLKNRASRLYSKFDNKNRQKIFNSLFELSIIKNTEDCIKYRDYTYSYMLWLIEYSKSKNIFLELNVVKKIDISHLDRDYFGSNPYIIQMISDNIISLKDIEDNNFEIYDLFKQFLYNSENLYKVYRQLFNDFSEYVDYLISDNSTWIQIVYTMNYISHSKTKKHFYKLLKKLVELTPTVNGFDKSDYCIQLLIDNSTLLSSNEFDDILENMNNNKQFFNSSKRKNDENIKNIEKSFGIDFNDKIEEIEMLEYADSYEPSFLDI